MAAVMSTMQELGSSAAQFNLVDVRSNCNVELSSAIGSPLFLMFICNHCPYVLHLIKPLVELANQAQKKGFFVVAISSNDAYAYPQDGPDSMREFALRYNFTFPYLYDESQLVAKNYYAACTPDFFVYDSAHKLRYRGQMDDSRPSNNEPVHGEDLRTAIIAVQNATLMSNKQLPSVGCNIKWKSGNEPDYF